MEYWELGFQLAVGFSPYDWAYDAASLMAGQDILTGDELTNFDKGAILFGFLTFGMGDDIIKVSKRLAKNQGVDSLPSLVDFGRQLRKRMLNGAAAAFQQDRFKGLLKAGEGLAKSLPGRLRHALGLAKLDVSIQKQVDRALDQLASESATSINRGITQSRQNL